MLDGTYCNRCRQIRGTSVPGPKSNGTSVLDTLGRETRPSAKWLTKNLGQGFLRSDSHLPRLGMSYSCNLSPLSARSLPENCFTGQIVPNLALNNIILHDFRRHALQICCVREPDFAYLRTTDYGNELNRKETSFS